MANWEQVVTCHMAHRDWSSVQIAAQIGCNPAYVRATIQRRGMKLARSIKAGRQLFDWERQAILDAYKDGEKLEAVASEFGVSIWAVSKIGRRAGCPPRSISGRPSRQAKIER